MQTNPNKRSRWHKNANPGSKIYFVGVKLPDFQAVKGRTKTLTLSVPGTIMLATTVPFFDLHFRLLSLICATMKHIRTNLYLEDDNYPLDKIDLSAMADVRSP